MRITQVKISNFRGVLSGTLQFDGTTVLLGDNNIGKSTVFEAIELTIGPDRLARAQAIDEHDFYGGRYLGAAGEPVPISIEVIVAGLSEQQLAKFRANLEFWHTKKKVLLDQIQAATSPDVVPVVRVAFSGHYEPENDDFKTKTWFCVPANDKGDPLTECTSRDKREFGFLHLRALRTGNRALSMERGSLLDVILRTYEVRTKMWESLLDKLRGLDVVGEADPEFGKILTAIRDAMKDLVPGEYGDAPHLRVSELTREDLRKVLKSFLATGVQGYAAPFQHQGSGTINALVLAMLSLIAKKREGRVIFAMEEPEISLPPHVQKRVVDKVRSLASQALFTSHSPYVVEEFKPEELMVVTKVHGTLAGTAINLPASIKPKAFRDGMRTNFCEALLARRVIVFEGKTELVAYPAAARRAAELMPGVMERLDTLGWAVFNAGSETAVAPFSTFFKSLGKKVATVFDKQDPAALAIIKSACDLAIEQPFAGFEELLTTEAPAAAQAGYVKALVADGEWPKSLQGIVPAIGSADTAYPPILLQLLKAKKAEFVAGFFETCQFADVPDSMLEAIAALMSAAAPTPAPPAAPPPPGPDYFGGLLG